MKRKSITMVLLIGSLMLWTLAAADVIGFIVEKRISVPYGSLGNELTLKKDANEKAGTRILKVAQNFKLSPSLPSSPPPF